jgi:ComF family protein
MLCTQCWEELFHPAAVPIVGAPPFLLTIAAGEYGGALRDLVQRAKFSADPLPLRSLVHLLEHALDSVGCKQFDLVTSVPGSPKRIRERGLDLPGTLARRLARKLEVPFRRNALRRMRDVPPQTSLHRKERLQNLEGVFEAGENLKGKKILVIDDVVTTGATALAISAAFEPAEPFSATFLALARTSLDLGEMSE